ncbi:Oidioi.mRNA.OKI2018_I69.chr2.g5540.t1.cds [Oikopleura dioica]|uniref:Oidioi.mRNA.OKI2018_I69.chr2.g5540.t1.cds n=1 Tax=Oikopleura dioica TaxID=34765 RepID=A0ABN7T6A0_OIKDI|nr:Oidioi.mRNA.OKI2018_I69.chr2.g5540.t1.cds [Oikopleura dioica]
MKDFRTRKNDSKREITTYGRSFRVKLKKEVIRLKRENANLIAANMELKRSRTDQKQAALKEINEDLEKAKREKGEIQEKLDIEKIRNADLQSEIEQCKSEEEHLKDEIKEEKARCSRATQDLKNDLEREDLENQEKNSLMVLSYQSKTEFLSYVLKPDGSESSRTIKMPSSSHEYHYLYWSISALVRGKVYVIGGYGEYKFRIAMINDCEIEELDAKLGNSYSLSSAAVTAADQQSALICFPYEKYKKCEEFDGSVVSTKPATKYSHEDSCLALYHDHAVAVGSYRSDGRKKVEKFDGDSWTELPDFPKKIYFHSCIGVYDGFLVLEYSKDVYLLRDSKWTVVGQLNEFHSFSSAARIGNTIYLVSGNSKPYAVEKLEWDGEQIASAEVINNHSSTFIRPIIFPVDEFYCT